MQKSDQESPKSGDEPAVPPLVLKKDNDELRNACKELQNARLTADHARKKYLKIYERSPVACFTLSPELIHGDERARLVVAAISTTVCSQPAPHTSITPDSSLAGTEKDDESDQGKLRSAGQEALFDRSASNMPSGKGHGGILPDDAGYAVFLLEKSPEPGRIVAANHEAEAMYGYAVTELLQRNITDLASPQSHNEISGIFQKLHSCSWVKYESPRRKKDGTEILVEGCAGLISHGEEQLILILEGDAADRPGKEDLLYEREIKPRLQEIFDGISAPLVMLAPDLRIRMLNKAAQVHYKIENKDTVLDRICHDTFVKDYFQCENCLIPSSMKERKGLCFERTNMYDQNRTEQVTFYPVEDVSGKFGGLIQVTDVTETKGIEEILSRADRLASLGQLSAGIAHEIRNPLSGISMFIDILADENKFARSEKEIEILQEVKQNVRRIDDIIKGVLGFARTSSVKSMTLDVNTVIRDALRLWKTQLVNDDIRLELGLAENLARVHGHDNGIQQVLHNLIKNALEAMGSGGTLTISTRMGESRYRKDVEAVIIRIQDTGPGMHEEIVEKIFDPFFTTKADGTGLGLSISHQIIKQHRGILSCKSRPNEGTIFFIELPQAPREAS